MSEWKIDNAGKKYREIEIDGVGKVREYETFIYTAHNGMVSQAHLQEIHSRKNESEVVNNVEI